jgi:hypothetical protein
MIVLNWCESAEWIQLAQKRVLVNKDDTKGMLGISRVDEQLLASQAVSPVGSNECHNN